MVFPTTVLSSIKEAIKSSGRLPEETTYALFELDTDGQQSNVMPPVVEITTLDTLRSTSVNTDFVGYSTDNNGNHIGRIYRAPFQMPMQIDIWTAENDEYDERELGQQTRLALYEYEDRQDDRPLPDPAEDTTGPLDDVTRFQLGNGTPANDLSMTPALRRWRQDADVWFEEVIDTAEQYGTKEYVETVRFPDDSDSGSTQEIEIVFDVTPNEQSPADEY